MLPQIDVTGQQRLGEASALIVGAGGLGCPVAMYLAAAGVGKLVIADDDEVDLSNLQRQIAHSTNDIGLPKTTSLMSTLAAINDECEVIEVRERLDQTGLSALVSEADVVLDCTDNFATRFAINTACVQHRVALVSGAAIRFEGQVMVYRPGDDNPCYQCVYPDTGELEERCSENGVIAPLVGIIGSMQAMEAIKCLLDIGTTVQGRLLILDALHMQWRELKVARDPACPVCGTTDR